MPRNLSRCVVHYFVTQLESVLLLDDTSSTLSCPSNSFVGHLVNFRFNDSETAEYIPLVTKHLNNLQQT